MGKLYTTYLAKMKQIPDTEVVAIIMRMPPFIFKESNVIHVPQLSPKKNLLAEYKADNDWDKFEEGFNNQMYNDPETMECINHLIEALEHIDVYLVCCEKDHNVCHRSLVGKYIKSLGYEWIEMEV